MINFENGAPFDPGFAPYVYGFSQNAIVADYEMRKLISLHQKKFKYKMLFPQLYKLLANSIAFYQGCLMWAYYLSKKFETTPIEISGNFSLGKSSDEYDYLAEINYIINFFEKIEKDAKYFLSKSANIPSYWKKIAGVYKEFLELNGNFVKTSKTNDIKLPKILNEAKLELDEILQKIEYSIKKGAIEKLLEVEIF